MELLKWIRVNLFQAVKTYLFMFAFDVGSNIAFYLSKLFFYFKT